MENYFKKSAWTNIFMITDHAVIYCPRQPHFHYWLRIGEILAQGYSKKFYQGEAPLRGSTPYLFYMPFFDRKGTRFLYVIYQTWDAVFHHQMKHREESWKYDAQRSIFDQLRGVSSGDETVSNAWYYFSNKMILEREIKDAKMSSFSSDFQTLIKH